MILHAVATVLSPFAAVLAVACAAGWTLDLLRAYVGPDRMLPPSAIAGLGTALITFLVAVTTAGLMPDLHGIEAMAGAALGAGAGLSLHALRLILGGLSETPKQFRVARGAAYLPGDRAPLMVKSIEPSHGYACTGPASGYLAYGIRLTLSGGEVVYNGYLDKATWERDLAGIALTGSYRTPFAA